MLKNKIKIEVGEYFKNVNEEDMDEVSEWIGDGLSRGYSWDEIRGCLLEYSGEEVKRLIEEDEGLFKDMYMLSGYVDGWLVDYVCG